MPTMSSAIDKQLTPLTADEEELFLCLQSRIDAYFRDFQQLEGFSVLTTNLDRLRRKVTLELRCVCYEYHDSFAVIDHLRSRNAALEDDVRRQQELCDQVIAEAEAMKRRFQQTCDAHQQEIDKLHALYTAQESVRKKQWLLESDKQKQQEVDALAKDHAAKMALAESEHEQHCDALRKQLDANKTAEIECMQVQLRMQITSQVSRGVGRKLARQEKLCEAYTEKIKHMQRRMDALQQELKHSKQERRGQTATTQQLHMPKK